MEILCTSANMFKFMMAAILGAGIATCAACANVSSRRLPDFHRLRAPPPPPSILKRFAPMCAFSHSICLKAADPGRAVVNWRPNTSPPSSLWPACSLPARTALTFSPSRSSLCIPTRTRRKFSFVPASGQPVDLAYGTRDRLKGRDRAAHGGYRRAHRLRRLRHSRAGVQLERLRRSGPERARSRWSS